MQLYFKILAITLIANISISCCGNRHIASNDETTTERYIPCTENGKSDSDFFRASASATSSSIGLAREKAITSAKSELGKTIMDKTIAIANTYALNTSRSDTSSFLKEIELVTNKAVDQTVSRISIICENYNESNSRYTTYMAVEIEKQTIIDKICELATKDISNFDKIAFEKLFRN